MNFNSLIANKGAPAICESITFPSKNQESSISSFLSPSHLKSLMYGTSRESEEPIPILAPLLPLGDKNKVRAKITPSELTQIKLFVDSLQQNKKTKFNLQSKQPPIIEEEVDSTKSLLKEKKTILKDLKNWEDDYKKWMCNLNEYKHFQGSILDVLNYFHINRENFVAALTPLLSLEQAELLHDYLNNSNDIFKAGGATANLFFNAVKWFMINQAREDLKDLENRCQDLENKIHSTSSHAGLRESTQAIEERLDGLRHKLIKEQQAAQVKGLDSLGKLMSKAIVFPIAEALPYAASLSKSSAQKIAAKSGKYGFSVFKHIHHIYEIYQARRLQSEWMHHLKPRMMIDPSISADSQQQLQEDVQAFLNSLTQCSSLKEVEKQFKAVGLSLELPEDFEKWQKLLADKRYCRYLIHSYYHCVGKQPVMNSAYLQDLLHQRQAVFEAKVEQSLPMIDQQIQACQEMSFAEIQKHFAKLHIHFDRLESPPQDKREWQAKIQSEDFRRSLAKQWVDYQETNAQLAEQAMRQALLSKNQVERSLLFYRGVESLVGVVVSITQIALAIPGWALTKIWSVLQTLVADLGTFIPGIGVVYLLFPETALKVDSVAMLFCESLVGSVYKPHEYSWEGYKVSFLIRWFKFVSMLCTMINWLEYGLVSFTIGIETLAFQRPNFQDTRFIQIQEKLEQQHLNCKQRVQELEERLYQLRIQDARSIIQPNAVQNGQKQQEFDPFENLTEALKDADFSYFPTSTLEFFEENLGIELTKMNLNQLKEKLENSFTLGEEDFIDAYRFNRSKFVKV